MTEKEKQIIQTLIEKSKGIRISVTKMIYAAKSGHIGGSLGMSDVFTVLYFHQLKHDPSKPQWPERDRLILSNGHIAPVRYAAMAHAGYFPVEELITLRKLHSRLQGHPHHLDLPGLEISTGSLGMGLGVAAGAALAAKKDKAEHRIYCSLGDGELQEGSVWEAAMFAGNHNLNNLIAFVDRNFIQIDGNTEDVMPLEPLIDKWKAFNWNVLEANGNHIPDIIQIFKEAKNEKHRPTVILFRTALGHPVSFMAGKAKWHGVAPNDEELKEALNDIENFYKTGIK
jgi:transketolase